MTVRKKIKRRNFLLSTVGLTAILLVLALPLPWSAGLPCEVKPADSDMVYAKISGYLEKLPVADGQRVTSGDLLLLQQNPYISWRLKEAILAATIDRLQVDRAQSSTESLGMVKVNQEALRDSQALIGELKRKQQLLKTHSAINGIFALYDRRLRPGKWLSKGEIIGEVYAPKSNRIIAYLEEEDIKKVRLQDNVKISLHDMLDSVSGKIVQINQVPARFTPSPLLNVFGGPILCYMTAPGEFAPLKPYFQIVIKVTGDNPLPAGRTGTAWVHKYSSIGGNIIRNILNVLQRELSF